MKALSFEVHAAQEPGEQALCAVDRLGNQRAIPRYQRQAFCPARGDDIGLPIAIHIRSQDAEALAGDGVVHIFLKSPVPVSQ